jgi:hypothetical protein
MPAGGPAGEIRAAAADNGPVSSVLLFRALNRRVSARNAYKRACGTPSSRTCASSRPTGGGRTRTERTRDRARLVHGEGSVEASRPPSVQYAARWCGAARFSGWRACSRLRPTVLSLVARLVRGRLVAAFAVRSLAARLVRGRLVAAFAVRSLAARLVRGRPAVRLVLRHPTPRLIISRVARLAPRPRRRIRAFGRHPRSASQKSEEIRHRPPSLERVVIRNECLDASSRVHRARAVGDP